jgi:hypothetical protein
MFFFNDKNDDDKNDDDKNDDDKNVEYGKVPFITFICVILSKLAYLPECGFLPRYEQIFGQRKIGNLSRYCNNDQPFVNLDDDIEYNPIPTSVLTAIKDAHIADIFNDKKIFKKCKDISFYTDSASNEKFIDFIKYAEFFNILNGSTNKKKTTLKQNMNGGGSKRENEYVQYISLAWSNYSTIYIVADKRSNSIFIIYRGTASFKGITSYLNFNTFNKNGPCDSDDAYIPGIFKITTEAIHTLLESVSYLATHFLKAATPNSVKVLVTGHSLGGVMATIFAYLYNGIRNTSGMNNLSVLSKQIICISVGASRCINDATLKRYNHLINQNLILYRRLVTKGDPIPFLPHKAYFGYHHPGDGLKSKNGLEYCQSTYSGLYGNFIDYDKSSDCKSKEDKVLSFIGDHNSYDHLNYLYVSYLSLEPTGFDKNEIHREPGSGDTVMRVILGSNKFGSKVAFFNLVKSRGANYKKPFFKFLVDVHNQDILMTHKAFLKLIAELKPDNSVNPVSKKILNEQIFDTADEAPNLNCFTKMKRNIKTKRRLNNKKGTRKIKQI